MSREDIDPVLQDVLLSDQYDQYHYEYSPAECMVHFKIPTTSSANLFGDNSDLLSDVDLNSLISGFSDNFVDDFSFVDNTPVSLDFPEMDLYYIDAFLKEGLDNDLSSDTSPSAAETEDAAEQLVPSVNSTFIQEPSYINRNCRAKQAVQKADVKVQTVTLGEPVYCPEYSAFRCPVENCAKLYAKLSHVRAHLRRHSGEKPYVCTWGDCEWRFARSDELARHRRSHSGDRPYACSECAKRFARSDHLAKHAKVHARRREAAAKALKRTGSQRNRRFLL